MPTDRLLRFTIAGSTLLMSLVFFFLLLGGNIDSITELFGGGEYLLKIVALILTTPVIGIMVSLISFEFLVRIKGYKIYYHVPTDRKLIEWILEEKETSTDWEKDARKMLAGGDVSSREFRRKFYPFYQVKVRKHINDSSLKFLDTKWSVIWVHRNLITALIISFLLTSVYVAINSQNFSTDHLFYKLFGLFFIGIYIASAYRHIQYALDVATENEHKLLMNAMHDEKQKLHESLPTRKETPSSLVWRLLAELFGVKNRM